MKYFVYILLSLKNHKSYVGRTEKLPHKRLTEHNYSTNSWTKFNGPFILLYYESYLCKEDCISREKFLKSGIGRKFTKFIIQNYSKSASAKGGPASGGG